LLMTVAGWQREAVSISSIPWSSVSTGGTSRSNRSSGRARHSRRDLTDLSQAQSVVGAIRRPALAPPGWGLLARTSWTEAKMADLQTDGARVLSLWRNEGISNYRKRPRISGQLAKLMIDIDSGEDREALTSAKPLRPIRPKPSAASKSRRGTTKRSRRSASQE
jgi:hypothetical protein